VRRLQQTVTTAIVVVVVAVGQNHQFSVTNGQIIGIGWRKCGALDFATVLKFHANNVQKSNSVRLIFKLEMDERESKERDSNRTMFFCIIIIIERPAFMDF
jgi:hypothetical protein